MSCRMYLQVICPTAPVIPITLNLGFRMPGWFDVTSLENLEDVRRRHLKIYVKTMNELNTNDRFLMCRRLILTG